MTRLHAGEHETEPERGLPEALPPGERLLWQGAPDWRVLARRGFHLPGFAGYFALLLAWRLATQGAEGAPWTELAATVGRTALLAAPALGFIAGLAWLVGRTALYTLTDRRLVLRIGVVLSVSFNLPLRRIEAAQLRRHADGSGDIALRLHPDDRIGALHLWPHVRPWRFARAEPMLRALPEVEPVGLLLSRALAASLEGDDRASRGARPADRQPGRPDTGGVLPHAA